MKLAQGFLTHRSKDGHYMISTGGTDFSGIVRNNSTAAFIIECLKTDTNEKEIADKVMGHYAGAVRENVEKDIAGVIEKLRSIDAIED
ncbi:MAG: PqqD family protein [Ruminococcus sp.]|nr:PqqD family protein [Ruminococcus sp.]